MTALRNSDFFRIDCSGAHIILAYIIMAYTGMTYIVMACIGMAYVAEVPGMPESRRHCFIQSWANPAYTALAVITCIIMANIVMAWTDCHDRPPQL